MRYPVTIGAVMQQYPYIATVEQLKAQCFRLGVLVSEQSLRSALSERRGRR